MDCAGDGRRTPGWRASSGSPIPNSCIIRPSSQTRRSARGIMTTPAPPAIDCDQLHPELMVADVGASAEFYASKLGFKLSFLFGEPPQMAGMNLGDVSLHLSRGTPAPQGCGVYFVVGNADELYDFHRANGVEIVVPPGDRPYGLRDYGVRDLDGYHLSFGHNLFNTGTPVPIERVDVPVRLEKRIAAILQDLAEYKRMSLSSCLEETLLHTFEPLDGQLRHIQELKRKHGVDYDCHASYRFVEE
jgi:catechol 2,3-dioxygenase-like lactoylglutathione lyase family enzyme